MAFLRNDVDHTYQHANHVECLSQTLPLFVVADHLEVLHSGGLDQAGIELPPVAGEGTILVKVGLRTSWLEACVQFEGKQLAGAIRHCLTSGMIIIYEVLITLLYSDYNEQ